MSYSDKKNTKTPWGRMVDALIHAPGHLSWGLLLHIHPRTLPRKHLRFSYTFGLGGITLWSLLLLIISGVILMFFYKPTEEAAYASMLDIGSTGLGQFTRNIHYYSGNLMVITALLHMFRVFFSGAYRKPRQLNWRIGIVLLFLVLASAFSGYLLTWDQNGFWAVTIFVNLLDYLPLIGTYLKQLFTSDGIPDILVFYTLHIMLIPTVLFFLSCLHFWQIRKSSGLASEPGDDEQVAVEPHLIVREISFAAIISAVLVVVSFFINAPLADGANPGLSPNPAIAPWYFAGIQELLIHFHPAIFIPLFPLCIIVLLLLIPSLVPAAERSPYFLSKKGRRMGKWSFSAGVFLAVGIVLVDHYANFAALMPSIALEMSEGLIPIALSLLILALFIKVLHVTYKPTPAELLQSFVILLVSSLATFTMCCLFFRGPGMSLVLPFS